MFFSKTNNRRSKQSIEKIKSESIKMLEKYPSRVIIYADKHPNSKNKNLPELKNNKFLVPDEFDFGQFSAIIRKNLKLDSSQGLFYFIGDTNVVPQMTQNISVLYNDYKDEDGRLYVYYETESVFGNN